MKKPTTIYQFKTKYLLTSIDLEDLVLELYEYSIKNNWSEQTLKNRLNLLQKLHRPYFIRLNKWLISFNLPTETTITKAIKSLENNVFTSVIDVKENNFHNHKTKRGLIKYLKRNPDKLIDRNDAKYEGYRVFLKKLNII